MTRDEEWLLDEKYGGMRTPEYAADCERLAAGEPLGYIIGWQPFLGLKIYLDSKPLIPRVETEWWTYQLLHMAAEAESTDSLPSPANVSPSPRSSFTFLDLCAGSGAIGCAALAKLPNAHVYFGDIDPAHETTIRKNIRENNLDETRATIGIGDLFDPFENIRFDVIAANPPYIPSNRPISRSVADYEPAVALFGGTDGLDIIRRIALALPNHLAKGGTAWIECDSAHASEACALFAAQGLRAEIRTDQFDQPRIISVTQ